ncbi:MAG: hypothetical protein K0R61_241 [Microvirga sp.]|nr:hypothetical protein [Microvirga sp.]
MASAIAVSFAAAVSVAISTTGSPVGISPVTVVGIARVRRVVPVSVVAVAVVAMAILATAISIAGPTIATGTTSPASASVPTGSTNAASATRAAGTTRASIIASAAGSAIGAAAAIRSNAASAAGSRAATICNSAATVRHGAITSGSLSTTDAARHAKRRVTKHRVSGAWSDRRVAANRTGHSISLVPLAGPIIHAAQSLGTNCATADFLTLYNMQAAVAVHGRISDGRYALRPRPKGLGRGWGADSEKEGCARQSKSVRALHVFTYIISQL